MKNILICCIIPLFAVFTACSVKPEPDPPAVTPVLETISITAGLVVDVNLGTITITYSVPVKISTSPGITLGNLSVAANATNKSVVLTFGRLEYATSYTLTIPKGSILNKTDNAAAEFFSISFSTVEYVAPNPDIPSSIIWNIDASPVNTNVSAGAKKVYDYLKQSFGNKIISSTMAEVNWNIDNAQWVYSQTGKWPAMACFDFIHYTRKGTNYDSWVDYNALTNNAIKYWQDGGIVALMWHWLDPSRITDEFYSEKTSFDISKIFDPTSTQYKAMIADIDEVATHLKKLKDAGVPLIWRPLHEAEGSYRYGDWFWWGSKGAESCVQLWKVMYNRLVNFHGLNNLIWVWTVSLDNYDYLWYADGLKWYPGKDYVDIIGIDIYDDAAAHGSHLDFFKKTALIAGSRKIVALTECGYIPDPDLMLANGDKWSYFMPWYGDYTKADKYNGAEYWKKIFSNSFVVTRSDLPSFK
ncbi:MAG: glycosyl hydrolase [Rikenellaceae bacterium]